VIGGRRPLAAQQVNHRKSRDRQTARMRSPAQIALVRIWKAHLSV